MRLARFARVRLLRHALPISLLILRKKTDCFAVYLRTSAQKLVLISCRVARTYVSVFDTRISYGFLMSLTIGLIFRCA